MVNEKVTQVGTPGGAPKRWGHWGNTQGGPLGGVTPSRVGSPGGGDTGGTPRMDILGGDTQWGIPGLGVPGGTPEKDTLGVGRAGGETPEGGRYMEGHPGA